MKIHWYSFRTIIFGALSSLILMALGIVYYSTNVYYNLAIESQRLAMEKLLAFETDEQLNILRGNQKLFGYKLQKEKKFKESLRIKNNENIEFWLDQSYQRYFVTAGLIDLKALYVRDISLNIIAASIKNQTSDTQYFGCKTNLDHLKNSSDVGKVKPQYALCLIDDELYSEVIIPIGTLKLKGYLHVLANISTQLEHVEEAVGMPITITSPKKTIKYKSSNWSESHVGKLILEYAVLNDNDEVGIKIQGLFDLNKFEIKVKEVEKKVLIFIILLTWMVLILVFYYLNRAYFPLNRLIKSAEFLLEGKYQRIEDKRLPFELVKPVQAFNEMIYGLEAESQKRTKIENELKDEKDFISITLNSINNAVIVIGLDEVIQFSNPAVENIFKLPEEALKGHYLTEAVQFYTDNACEIAINKSEIFFNPSDNTTHVKTLFVSDYVQNIIEVEYSCSLMHRKDEIFAYVLIFRDVTEDRQLKRQLNYDAYHDRLTGLLNRLAFEEHFVKMIIEDQLESSEHIIAYMDLDKFKVVNDVCGHAAGDLLLKRISKIFKQASRKTDVVARLGGDEFGLILPYCSIEKAQDILQAILKEVIEYKFIWDGKVFTVGLSIGIAPFGLSDDTLDEQLAIADAACFVAKKAGGNQLHLYTKDDSEVIAKKGAMNWVAGINEAFIQDRFVLYAQPISSLSETNEQSHYEILIRCLDEEGVLIPPNAFLPAAERYNLIERIDLFVVNTVIKWLETHQAKHPSLIFSINLSGRSIGSQAFQEKLKNIIINTSIKADSLCFEITETAIIDDIQSSVNFINSIKALGPKFSLDDFGSGLSSFAYLKQFPVDYLKIDGMFVKDILNNKDDYVIVRSITEVGHSFGMKVIAEFVESEAMYPLLKEVKVDYAQGWAVGKPQPLSFLE